MDEQRESGAVSAITRGSVVEFLAEFTQDPSLLTASGPLVLSECGLDSFGTFEFVIAFEERFGLQIDDAHFDPTNFESVDAIVSFVQGPDVTTSGRASGQLE